MTRAIHEVLAIAVERGDVPEVVAIVVDRESVVCDPALGKARVAACAVPATAAVLARLGERPTGGKRR